MLQNINYSKKVLKHFRNPHNLGKIKDASGTGEVGNFACGDVMRLYLKVKDNVITGVKFETYGCAAAIATSSVITDMVKGKTVEEALKLTNRDIVDSLEGLPPVKIHCSLLSVDALSEAIYDYYVREGKETPKELIERHKRIETLAKQEHHH